MHIYQCQVANIKAIEMVTNATLKQLNGAQLVYAI